MKDQSIHFVLEAHKNYALADACIRHLRNAYPRAAVTLIVEGENDPAYERLSCYNAKVLYGERLWIGPNAAKLWQRRFDIFEKDPADYLVKIDTDTAFYRPLSYLPDGECLFGTLLEQSFITGGFIGMSRQTVSRITVAKGLEKTDLSRYVCSSFKIGSGDLCADDRALGDVAYHLGIKIVEHPEVCSLWRTAINNSLRKWAVVHPCKSGELDPELTPAERMDLWKAKAFLEGMAGDALLPGSSMAAHMAMLRMLAKTFAFGHVVELGVNRGWSTLALFSGSTDAGKVLYSYDGNPSCSESLHQRLKVEASHPILDGWKFRCKDSVLASEDFPPESVSFLFIDTNHRLEHTRRELAAWLPKMHPAGVMCGHDYLLDGWEGVKYGVKEAVDEFAALHAGRFTLQILPHDYGVWILKPKSVL